MPAPPMSTFEPRRVVAQHLTKSFGETEVLRGIDLDVEPGSSTALLGPSGCGKTTLLRLLAGLERPDSGSITIDETVMAGDANWVAPEKRNVGMVFQDWALFPHLTVGKNVGYGLPRAERSGPRVADALAMVGMEGFEDRMPSTLSGGQQQRVALARAIAPAPSVLLLDEPFSNLDAALRVGVRTEVHRLLTSLGITSLFVTHDQQEAFVLGDSVAVMRDGLIEQVASPRELYTNPVNPWVASFVGDVNLLSATAHADVAHTAIGDIALRASMDGAVQVLIRPEDLIISPGGDATVNLVEYYGHDVIVRVDLADGSEALVRSAAASTWHPGDPVTVRFQGSAASAFVR